MTGQTKKIGQVELVIKVVDMDEQLAKRVMKARGLKEEDLPVIYEMLRYNAFNMQQFADLTGKAISTLEYNFKPDYNDQDELVTKLDYCYPTKSLSSKGPKFIVRNKKSMDYLLTSLK